MFLVSSRHRIVVDINARKKLMMSTHLPSSYLLPSGRGPMGWTFKNVHVIGDQIVRRHCWWCAASACGFLYPRFVAHKLIYLQLPHNCSQPSWMKVTWPKTSTSVGSTISPEEWLWWRQNTHLQNAAVAFPEVCSAMMCVRGFHLSKTGTAHARADSISCCSDTNPQTVSYMLLDRFICQIRLGFPLPHIPSKRKIYGRLQTRKTDLA